MQSETARFLLQALSYVTTLTQGPIRAATVLRLALVLYLGKEQMRHVETADSVSTAMGVNILT